MAGITPTSGVLPPMMPVPTTGASPQKAAEAKTSFAQMLKTYVGEVDGRQQASYEAMRDLIAGRTEDVLPVVNAVAKADLSFKLLMGVRNKVIEAYKQTMNMQV
ncbi:MAG TPA: flagellar hook-basal body complex protein FliE [Phycisphaerae bacterium]|nr:flagellar hook-basal body complex protein FliE [Phycisphaerae bacterium]